MIRVGSKSFQNLPITKKITILVKRDYKQAAFRSKANAVKFAIAWRTRGYKASLMRSSGQTVEGGYQKNAYYVIAHKR